MSCSPHTVYSTQNDLNLVTKITGAAGAVLGEIHGNKALGAADFDSVNVEKVVWPNLPAGGSLEIRVQVDTVTKPGTKQNFAVVWTAT